MKTTKTNRKAEGFTIIEVMIVLAIAAVILLIVFLAVPALQRSSRNTQRKNDVAALLGAVNEYEGNNSGAVPAASTDVTASAKTGYYSGDGTAQGNINLVKFDSYTTLDKTKSADDRVQIVTGAKCGASGAVEAGSARQVVAQYLTETSSGYSLTCQEG